MAMRKNRGINSTKKHNLKRRLFGGRATASCCFCRRSLIYSQATIEHVIPLSESNSWKIENLRLSCDTCNQMRGVQDFREFQNKVRGNPPS
jgi:5-methylcytosine-specific restriction endonuclease McrA